MADLAFQIVLSCAPEGRDLSVIIVVVRSSSLKCYFTLFQCHFLQVQQEGNSLVILLDDIIFQPVRDLETNGDDHAAHSNAPIAQQNPDVDIVSETK